MSDATQPDKAETPRNSLDYAGALHFEGRTAEAEALLESALRHWPGDAQLHGALARMRWLRGAGEEAGALLERAIAARPDDLKLRLICADVWRRSGRLKDAHAMLEQSLRLAPGTPAFMTSFGVVLDDMGRSADALRWLRAAAATGRSANAQRNLIPALLRSNAADEALSLAQSLLRAQPHDQHLIAHEALALRALNDPEYFALYDYARLVRRYELAAPAGYASIASFNEALADSLTRAHRAQTYPLDQSLRGGTQTDRTLADFKDPVIDAFLQRLQAPISEYVAALAPNSAHALDRRHTGRYRLSGSWSVRLKPGGFHVNHVHPAGWISSVYYVSTPESAKEPTQRNGWLKLGEPPFAHDRFSAEMFVQPRAGLLVLFPSYVWHGTNAFSDGERLTAAFDVIPVR